MPISALELRALIFVVRIIDWEFADYYLPGWDAAMLTTILQDHPGQKQLINEKIGRSRSALHKGLPHKRGYRSSTRVEDFSSCTTEGSAHRPMRLVDFELTRGAFLALIFPTDLTCGKLIRRPQL